MDLISTMIHSDISLLDDAIQWHENLDLEDEDEDDTDLLEPRVFHGSVLAEITFLDLDLAHSRDDAAFTNFRIKLATYLNSQPVNNPGAPQGCHPRIVLRNSDKVIKQSLFWIGLNIV